ncbi:MAG: CHRD domain-containing protein [Caldilineaceae bacterium]|nr:CHRD domain-containing protein [Caldilineaceae bacterium]
MAVLLAGIVLIGCAAAQTDPVITVAQVETNHETAAHAMSSPGVHTPELEMPAPFTLNPDKGSKIGLVYEAYLSPEQEGDDEEDTPAMAPAVFKSTAPSVPRHLRTSRGHGVISFTNDLSKAFVHVAVDNVNPDDIVMFHIHCGRPGQLGPILVDFGLKGDLTDYFEDGYFAMEVVNEDIDAAVESGEGIVGAFASGCPIVATNPMDKVKTVGGMQFIAEQGELYFNLHTKGQTFFGDIRGQLQRVETKAGN